jgi:hypothetical protein
MYVWAKVGTLPAQYITVVGLVPAVCGTNFTAMMGDRKVNLRLIEIRKVGGQDLWIVERM